jgi:hypothetical protein
MAGELEDLKVSTEAQALVWDLANGCTVSRSASGAPSIVIPPHSGEAPKTRDRQVSYEAIEELLGHGFVHLVGETTPQPCKLTLMGKGYYDLFLKR